MYEIIVERTGRDTGKLWMIDEERYETVCWWDPDHVIPAEKYHDCSATMMHTKQREGIFIPDVKGYSGIFLHKGTGPSWSDGCIVAPEEVFMKIWNTIEPKNGHNVIVDVRDR
ncbi:MAG: hypothetical protein ACQGVK_20525 [Myxococcota bacterium]